MWQHTTHDWASTVDVAHPSEVRADPTGYSPGGALHLVLETLADPLDEVPIDEAGPKAGPGGMRLQRCLALYDAAVSGAGTQQVRREWPRGSAG